MIRLRLTVMWLGLIAVAGARPRADAQPAPAASGTGQVQVAAQYVKAGLAAQGSHDYSTAITFYRKAYHLVPNALLIFDMAQCHRLAGQIDNALTLYRRFLSEVPTGPEAQTARDKIAELEAATALRAPGADAATADALLAEPQPAAAPTPSPPPPPPVAAEVHADLEASGAESPGHAMRVYGIATGAVGVVAFAIGAGFGLRAQSIADQEGMHGAPFSQSTDDRGRRDGYIAIAGMIGGGVLVVGGAALTWFGFHQRPSTEHIAIAPLAAPGLTGLVVTGSLP